MPDKDGYASHVDLVRQDMENYHKDLHLRARMIEMVYNKKTTIPYSHREIKLQAQDLYDWIIYEDEITTEKYNLIEKENK